MRISPRSLCAPLALLLLACGPVHADTVYLALGDSLTFGLDPSTPASLIPSFADQGFVKPFADSLASSNGGVRPDVLNLAISGELSTSFFTGTPPPGWTTAPGLNLNYSSPPAPMPGMSQNDLMVSSIASIHAASNSVGFVSLVFGSNDIFYLVGTPAFQNASPADQQAMLIATLGIVQSNYLTVLGELKTLAPEAKVILPGYYNPFPTSDPEHAFYGSIISVFDSFVSADAAAFGATFVDLAPSFLGRELELTNIGIGDVHPNQAGYAVIAADLSPAAVPEPSSILMMAVGISGLLVIGVRPRTSCPKDLLTGA